MNGAVAANDRAWIAYTVPTVVFGTFTLLESYVPPAAYPLMYAVKVAAVTAALLLCSTALREIRPSADHLAPSILLGLVIFAGWIALDKLVPYHHLGTRVGFDPTTLGDGWPRAAFLGVRFFGLVAMVPVMEEIFWRAYLLRQVTTVDFLGLPLGSFSLTALAVTVVASAVAHPEWLVAAITSIILAFWLRRTRSLFAIIVAHAVANAALGVYILGSRDWQYW